MPEPDWPDPDFGKGGARGSGSGLVRLIVLDLDVATGGSYGRNKHTTIWGGGRFSRLGAALGPVHCRRRWVLFAEFVHSVPSCKEVNHEQNLRSALLYAIWDAHQRCRPTNCEKVLFRIMHERWGCDAESRPTPTAEAEVVLAVYCWKV